MKNWIVPFGAGMIAGGFTGYYICKKKYNIVKADVVECEVGTVNELVVDETKVDTYKEELYSASYVRKQEKTADEEWDEAEKFNPVEPEFVPYVISPEAFVSEHDDYAKITLKYYEDNEVLEYEEYKDNEDQFADIGTTIGYDAVNHFGEYEEDAVFVRNEALGNDYEVILMHGPFDEGGD